MIETRGWVADNVKLSSWTLKSVGRAKIFSRVTVVPHGIEEEIESGVCCRPGAVVRCYEG
jgi:hypothetical protein